MTQKIRKSWQQMCVCVRVRVCVRERERERERSHAHNTMCACMNQCTQAHVCMCMCEHACVCVRERERERERETDRQTERERERQRGRQTEKQTHTHKHWKTGQTHMTLTWSDQGLGQLTEESLQQRTDHINIQPLVIVHIHVFNSLIQFLLHVCNSNWIARNTKHTHHLQATFLNNTCTQFHDEGNILQRNKTNVWKCSFFFITNTAAAKGTAYERKRRASAQMIHIHHILS